MGSKKKTYRQRNPVVQKMLQRSQNAGLHQDMKKEHSRKACRENIDDLVDEWHEDGGDLPVYEYLGLTKEEYSNYIVNNNLPE